MADAQVAHQTACLRPVASDGLLVLGCVPGLHQVYVATGGACKGILYGPAIGHAIADLVLGRDNAGRARRLRARPLRWRSRIALLRWLITPFSETSDTLWRRHRPSALRVRFRSGG